MTGGLLFPKPPKRKKRRGHRDPVDPVTRQRIFNRDRGCVAAQIDNRHGCRDAFGWPHRWDDLSRMTLDHVQEGYGMMSRRAPSDDRHMVAMCHSGNLDWGPRHREEERAWLARASG